MEDTEPPQKKVCGGLSDTVKAACCSFIEAEWKEVSSVELSLDISATEVGTILVPLIECSLVQSFFMPPTQLLRCCSCSLPLLLSGISWWLL